jgi:MinD-like ATPase involved in chromosome partitioning or flagellar assembly
MREGRDEGAGATVRVTLECSGSQLEAMVATDWPVASLVPDLLRKVYGQQGAETAGRLSWGLGFPGGQPFPAVSTLADHGVRGGAVLRLDQIDLAPTPATNPVAPSPPTPPSPSGLAAGPALANAVQLTYETMPPSRRTSTVLPRQPPLLDRLGSVLGAVFERRQATVEDRPGELEPGVTVSPTRLTVLPRASISERVRVSWRDSNYGNRLDRAIQAPQLRRCVTIAVMSPKGGVGKTTLTALLGSLFAMLRRDRIVAVDNNPDFGSLGRTLTPEHAVFVDDLLEVLDSPELTVTELDANLARAAHGMMVLPAPTDPVRMARLDEEAYTRVIHRLQDMVGVVLLDCGTGLHEPASRAALRTADQVVLITDAEPATASLVTEAAALLRRENVPIWLLVNKMARSRTARLDLPALESFIPQARGLVTVAFEQRAARIVSAGLFDWRDAPKSWRRSVREVAADLVAAWPSLDVTIGGRPVRRSPP